MEKPGRAHRVRGHRDRAGRRLGQSRELRRAAQSADARCRREESVAVELGIQREPAHPSGECADEGPLSGDRVLRRLGEPATQAAERIHPELELHGVLDRGVQAERSARGHRERRGLQAQRVEVRAPLGEAETRVAGEDPDPFEDRAVDRQRADPFEVRERIEADVQRQARGELATRGTIVVERCARVERREARAPGDPESRCLLVHPQLGVDATGVALERGGHGKVGECATDAERSVPVAAQRDRGEGAHECVHRERCGGRIEPVGHHVTAGETATPTQVRLPLVAVAMPQVGPRESEVAPRGVEPRGAGDRPHQLREIRIDRLHRAQVKGLDVEVEAAEDRVRRVEDVEFAAPAGAGLGARHVRVREAHRDVVDHEPVHRPAPCPQAARDPSGEGIWERFLRKALDEPEVERRGFEVDIAQHQHGTSHDPGHAPADPRRVTAQVHRADRILECVGDPSGISDVERHPAAALGGERRADPGDIGERDLPPLHVDAVARRKVATPPDLPGRASCGARERGNEAGR